MASKDEKTWLKAFLNDKSWTKIPSNEAFKRFNMSEFVSLEFWSKTKFCRFITLQVKTSFIYMNF